jgi:hypothetical protein
MESCRSVFLAKLYSVMTRPAVRCGKSSRPAVLAAGRGALRFTDLGSRRQVSPAAVSPRGGPQFLKFSTLFLGVHAIGDNATWPTERHSRERSRRPRISDRVPFALIRAKRKG